ncbi:hypothetical protein HWV01_02070 [Moritella sp. 5]|uniref:hypothetical protein n=1 Tax=Moritella sp. 5 TaxID=2746231 RepID=UPI001BAD2284|nr:hypothetical protein [Moritella sp. 5]QUM79196.1 hypothetical protein HWV01_02070 [Moritella sp. 5]
MIGWKIACTIDKKEVVAEVASQPAADCSEGGLHGMIIYVYHDSKLKPVYFSPNEDIKVIERN